MTNWGPDIAGLGYPPQTQSLKQLGSPDLTGFGGGGTDFPGEGRSGVPQGVRSVTLGNSLQHTSPGRVSSSTDADSPGSVAQQSRSPNSGGPDSPGRSGDVVA